MKFNILVLVLMISFTSCDFSNSKKKIETKTDERDNDDNDISLPTNDKSIVDYMNSLEFYNEDLLKKMINELSTRSPISRSLSVWGIGSDYRVYEWNGVSWAEPNPSARLKWVDVSLYGGGVWGIGPDERIYKWNGVSWAEPNPQAGLNFISAITGDIAIGIGDEGILYITDNGGMSWSRFTNIKGIRWTSVGNTASNFFWGVDINFNPIHYNSSTYSWETKNAPQKIGNVSAIFSNGLWAKRLTFGSDGYPSNHSSNIYKSLDGNNFFEPNKQAQLSMISSYGDDLTAWGLGENGRVFTTSNGGLSWSEPNPSARLIHISVGNN